MHGSKRIQRSVVLHYYLKKPKDVLPKMSRQPKPNRIIRWLNRIGNIFKNNKYCLYQICMGVCVFREVWFYIIA